MYPCIEMLDERKEQHCFARGCLLISMTFYEFSKPGVNFHDFSRPEKNKMEFHDFSRFSMTGYTLESDLCFQDIHDFPNHCKFAKNKFSKF